MIPTVHPRVPNTSSLSYEQQEEHMKRQEHSYLLRLLRSQRSDGVLGYPTNASRKIYDQSFSPLSSRVSNHQWMKMEFSAPSHSSSLLPKKRVLPQPNVPDYTFKRARSETPPSECPIHIAEPAQPIKIPKGTKAVMLVSDNDVLSGRGGATNMHAGNRFFRSLIDAHREKYLRARKNDKPGISRSIVNIIRRRNGAFLKKDEKSGHWVEIGDDLAREKTSQALRQRAPDHRRRIIEEDNKRVSKFCSDISKPNIVVPQRLSLAMPHKDLMLEYLVMKEKQAELQYHLQMVEKLKQRLIATGGSSI